MTNADFTYGRGPRVLHFGEGLAGFPVMRKAELTALSDSPGFLLLRALDMPGDVSFITMPLNDRRRVYPDGDLDGARQEFGARWDDLEILLLVTLIRNGTQVLGYANLRAPLMIDTSRCEAVQIVLQNPAYPFRKLLHRKSSSGG